VKASAALGSRKSHDPNPGWSDDRLVRECLKGNDEAWRALIDKYKNLIYSIPFRYGASPEDAADIFQTVCVELFNELSKVRKTAALRGWLITVTTHQSFHWKRKHLKRANLEQTNLDMDEMGADVLAPTDVAEEIEREQMLKEAAASLSPRCQEMIRLLFYQEPPLPYREVARRLGLATGSIGFIRGRCLQRLQKALQAMGF
jgi:RNA polymerase sigma factor (sigma-70 family)